MMAILLAPAFAALLICGVQVLHGSMSFLVWIFFYGYFFALVPGAIAIAAFDLFNVRNPWIFLVAGFMASLLATGAFVTVTTEKFVQFWEFLIIGPVAGIFAWAVRDTSFGDWIAGIVGSSDSTER